MCENKDIAGCRSLLAHALPDGEPTANSTMNVPAGSRVDAISMHYSLLGSLPEGPTGVWPDSDYSLGLFKGIVSLSYDHDSAFRGSIHYHFPESFNSRAP